MKGDGPDFSCLNTGLLVISGERESNTYQTQIFFLIFNIIILIVYIIMY